VGGVGRRGGREGGVGEEEWMRACRGLGDGVLSRGCVGQSRVSMVGLGVGLGVVNKLSTRQRGPRARFCWSSHELPSQPKWQVPSGSTLIGWKMRREEEHVHVG